MSIYLDVMNDEGKPELLALDTLADLLDEAAIELELAAPRVSFHLFLNAKRLRTVWSVTGLPQSAPAQTCAITVCPGCGGTGCPACTC